MAELIDRSSYLAAFDEDYFYRLVVVLRPDLSPFCVERRLTDSGLWVRKLHVEQFQPWAEFAVEQIKEFATQELGLALTGEVFNEGFHRLEFSSPPLPLGFADELLQRRLREHAVTSFNRLKEFIEEKVPIRVAESEFDLEWVPDYFFTWPREEIEQKFGWALIGDSKPAPELKANRRTVLKAASMVAAFYLGLRPKLPEEVFAKEQIGMKELYTELIFNISIDDLRIPARPLELIKWKNLWNSYYASEFSTRTYYYWKNRGYSLYDAAVKAAQDLEAILNDIGSNYYIRWRLADQIMEVRVSGDKGEVRIRPVIYDTLYRSTPHHINSFAVKEGLVKTLDNMICVIGGEDGYWQSIEPVSQSCSNPFGGQCETGCLVGCETYCESDPCMVNCQTCQSSCETFCQVCSPTCYQKCGYSLSCDCSVDASGSTVTVSGRVCYDDPVSGCKPQSGETVQIYHASWGTTYVATTDSQGYYRKSGLPRPPSGSTPIYVRWTDPNGVKHECTTSACFGSSSGSGGCTSNADCPPGYECVNGTCQPGSYYIDNVQWSLDNFCTSGFSVSGTLRDSSGAKASGRVRIEVNGKQLGEINVNGDFTVGFNKSQYADVLGCSNTITLTAISSSGVVGRSVSTTKDCPCNCSYSVSCTVSSAQVNDGGSVTFSGQLSSTNCGVGTQPVKIYDNNSLVATATTDSQGRWSATLTLSGAGTHTLKAEAPDGSTCTQSVTVTQQSKTASITLKWSKTGVPFLEAISIDAFVDGVEVFSYTTPFGDPIEYLVDPYNKKLSPAARLWLRQRYNIPSDVTTDTASDVIRYRLMTELGYTDTTKINKVISGIQSVANDGYKRWYGVEESVGGIITKVCPDSPPPYPGCDCLRKSWTVSECGTTWFRAEKSSTVTL